VVMVGWAAAGAAIATASAAQIKTFNRRGIPGGRRTVGRATSSPVPVSGAS
jgi:hypothetical protein